MARVKRGPRFFVWRAHFGEGKPNMEDCRHTVTRDSRGGAAQCSKKATRLVGVSGPEGTVGSCKQHDPTEKTKRRAERDKEHNVLEARRSYNWDRGDLEGKVMEALLKCDVKELPESLRKVLKKYTKHVAKGLPE